LVDQAEELFSAEAGQEARALLGLARDLFGASDGGASQLRLIVAATIRTDRYEVMQTAEELSGVDTLLFNDLKPMRTDRFRQVIDGPARRSTEGGHRLTLESHLVDRLLADASATTTAGGDTLPLLSGTMSRLFADYGHTGELTLAQYERMGGIDSVVQTEIDKLLSNDDSVRAKQLVLLREAFIPWLATVSDQDEPMRRIALWSDLPQASREMVEKFVDARILIRDRRRLGDGEGDAQDVVEIALESFLRQWEELAEWLRDEREHLKAADELLRDADRWQTSDQDPVYLYPGPLLEKAEKLAATPVYGRQLESTREFLVASRENVSQQQRRNAIRLWLVLAVTIVVAFVAVAGFFSARRSQAAAERSAQDATAQKLVAEAQAMLADTREGDDLQALHELLAANKLANQPNDRPLLDALVNRFSMLKVLKTEEPVIGVAFAKNGRRLALAEPAGIRIWDTSVPGWQDNIRDTGQRLAAGTAKLTSMAISPDGRMVAAGDDAGNVQVWDTSEQDPAGRVVGSKHEGRVTSVAFSRDGRIASAGVDGVVDISSPDGGPSPPIVTGAEIFSVAFSPSGDRLALGRADGTIQLFDVNNRAPVPSALRANAHIDGVMSVAFSPDGQFLASGGADNKVRLWRAMTVDPIREMSGHTATVTGVAFNANSTRIVSGGNDKTVQLFDVATGTRIGDPMRGHGGLVLAVDFVSDSNEIVSGGNEHTMRLWDAVMGQPISTAMTSRTGPVTDVAISPDGHEIASSGTDKTVRLWNADTGAQIDSLSHHTGAVTSVAFSPVGRVVATASTDGTIRLWRPGSDAAPTKYDAGRPLTAVEFDATGDRLASAGVDGQVTIWDIRSGRPALLENKDHAIVYGVAFDPKKRDRLASVSASGYLRMWQVTDGRQLWERDEATELPEAVRAEELLAQGYPGSLISVAFSPDGLRVASGGVDWTTAGGAVGFLQRWNVEDGSPVGEPIKVGNAVMGIAFSPGPTDPGGDQLVVASFDPYEVQLWNADTPGAAQFIFADHQAQVVSVAISPDGRRIVSGSADGSVRIWPNLPTVPADAAICAKLTSSMTEGEWDAWISEEIPYQPTCAEEPAGEPN
jgi:WD40 repeat protein